VAIRGSFDALLWVDCKPVVEIRFDSVFAKYFKGTTKLFSLSVTEI